MFTNIDGLNIHYEVFGDGEPLVILHGWGASINSMYPIWNHFKDKYKVFAVDFPGQGNESDDLKSVWGVLEYSEMIKKFMEKLDIRKPNVIAHSFGGRVTIYLSSTYPNIFNKIILVDSAGIKPKFSMSKFLKVSSFKVGKVFLKTFYSEDKRNEKIKKFRAKFSSSDYGTLKSDVMRETFSKVINLDLTKNLSRINNDVLIVWGENDTDTPLYMAKVLNKKIKNSNLKVIKGAKHFSYIDKPMEFCIIADSFLL